MRTNPKTERESIQEWYAESLRLTAFTTEDLGNFDGDWFAKFAQNDDISFQEERRSAAKRYSTIHEEGNLTVATSPGIFHLIFASLDPFQGFDPSMKALKALSVLKKLSSEWLEAAPQIQRLAFGAVFKIPVESREVGYQRVSDYLNFDIDGSKSYDFSYQINRKRKIAISSTSHDLTINRLSKWSIAMIGKFDLIPGGSPTNQVYQNLRRIELDINTDPEHIGNFLAEDCLRIFGTLVDFGKEIVEQGDIE